jgi:hypothetical protein
MRLSRPPRPASTLLAAAIVATGIAAAPSASAATNCPTLGYKLSTNDGVHFQHITPSTIKYYIDESGQPYSGASNDIRAALATWSNDKFSTLRFTYAGTTKAKNAQDGISTISWRTPQQLKPPQPDANAWTLKYPPAAVDVNEFDIVFNTGFRWSHNAAPSTYDVQTLALHESGHAVGLNHVSCTTSVMHESFNYQELIRTPGSRDLAGLRFLYPIPAPAPAPALDRTGVVSYDQMRPGAPHNGYFVSAWQPFTAQSNRITLLAATVGNSALPAGGQVATTLRLRLCTSPTCSTVLADRSPQITNFGSTSVDIGDVPVTKGSTYYIVWSQPAPANGRTWVTYWWGGGSTISTSDVMQASVRGFNA